MIPSQAKTILDYYRNKPNYSSLVSATLTAALSSEIIYASADELNHFRQKGIKLGGIMNDGVLLAEAEDLSNFPSGQQTIIELCPALILNEIRQYTEGGNLYRTCQIIDVNQNYTPQEIHDTIATLSDNMELLIDLGKIEKKAQLVRAGGPQP